MQAKVGIQCSANIREIEDAPARRLASIDLLRGIVMIVMALDHTREYFHASGGVDPTDPNASNLILFATRWITYFCAPTFVLLTGVAAYLRGLRSRAGESLGKYLLVRGTWLIVLELTLIGLGFTFDPGFLFLQVIWVIGAGMITLALIYRIGPRGVLGVGCLIALAHDMLNSAHQFQIAGQAGLLEFLNGSFSLVTLGPAHGVLIYSALGWIGILLAGYGLGPLYAADPKQRRRFLCTIGMFMVLIFLAVRMLNKFGDPNPWSLQADSAGTVMSFMRVSKYPPSLDFTLATLGPMLILLAGLEKAKGAWTSAVGMFGRVPLFYYLLHIYAIHGLAALTGMLSGLPFAAFTNPLKPPPEFGYSLAVVYLIWLAIVGGLYVPCRWFESLRQRRSDWWLSYF